METAVRLFAEQSYFCKGGVTHPENRSAQNRSKLNVPLRIIEHLQQAQTISDFRGFEISRRSLTAHRNAGKLQDFNISIGSFGQRAHQNYDVPVLDRSVNTNLLIIYFEFSLSRIGPDHPTNPPGNHRRLSLSCCNYTRFSLFLPILFFLLFLLDSVIEQMQLDTRPIRRFNLPISSIIKGASKHCSIVIFNCAKALAHQPGENQVYKIKQILGRAEVPVQINASRFGFSLRLG